MKRKYILLIAAVLSTCAFLATVMLSAASSANVSGPFAAPPEKSDPNAIRVATYNIRGPKDNAPNNWASRLPRMVQTIKENGFEIFGVQEGMKGPMEELGKALNYEYFGVGRDKNRSDEHCCIFFDPTRFKVVQKDTFWLSDSPSTPGSMSWNTACPRICTWGLMEDLKTRDRFVFANTHLDHVSPTARLQGALLIINRLAAMIDKYPLILTGDFNSTSTDQSIRMVLTRLQDSRAASETDHYGAGDETYHAYQENRKNRTNRAPIDFVFVNRYVRVLKHGTINDFRNGLASSDHFPVTAEVLLLKPSK